MKYEFPVTRTTNPKEKTPESALGFGKHFTDHMFLMNYTPEKGWHDGRIVPYGNLKISPAARVFHYGQEMFEGIKAYYREGDVPVTFRVQKYAARARLTCERMCIPPIDAELMEAAVNQLVYVDRDWMPKSEGTALYIRPFIIATEPKLDVNPSSTYLFVIILSPVGAYYEEGLAPTKLYVEQEFTRSIKGGTGGAKVGGNYAGALLSQEVAHEQGFSQVLWLDGVNAKYIEEIGTSNAFFVIGDEVITAPLEGTILAGVTRDSIIQILKGWGITVKEERLAIDDLWQAYQDGKVKEIFATGTAAAVSPVGVLKWLDHVMTINNGEVGELSQKLYDYITGIHYGKVEDIYGWIKPVK